MIAIDKNRAVVLLDEFCEDEDYFESAPEATFQSDVKAVLQCVGVSAIKMPPALEKNCVLPDLLCTCIKGVECEPKTFFIELKCPDQTLSKIQEITFAELNRNFLPVYIVDSWESLSDLLTTLGLTKL